jgi:hypothetical protein
MAVYQLLQSRFSEHKRNGKQTPYDNFGGSYASPRHGGRWSFEYANAGWGRLQTKAACGHEISLPVTSFAIKPGRFGKPEALAGRRSGGILAMWVW